MRVPGVPYDQGSTHGPLNPIAICLHRTYGGWVGSYGVPKGSTGIGFHFLVGRDVGQWVQFADTSQKCWHAAGGNSWSVGVEFVGVNEDRLTDWQVTAGAQVIDAVCRHHHIPLVCMNPGAGRPPPSAGVRHHANVPGSNHTDFVQMADWQRLVAAMGGRPEDEGDDMTPEQAQQLQAVAAAMEALVAAAARNDTVPHGGAATAVVEWEGGTYVAVCGLDGVLRIYVHERGQGWREDWSASNCDPTGGVAVQNHLDGALHLTCRRQLGHGAVRIVKPAGQHWRAAEIIGG